MSVPEIGKHGKIVCEVLRGEGVTVTGKTDSGITLKFDGDERTWPLGIAAVESGRFVEFDE